MPQDNAEATKWFRKAADQGDANAQLNLGLMYRKGQGVPQDYVSAAVWFRKAAEQRIADAQAMLGAAYVTGLGVPEDKAEAYFWLNLAASGKLDSPEQERVVKMRDEVASHLTSAVLAQTQERARKRFEAHSAVSNPQ